MKTQAETTPELIFCYSEETPGSLVMLYNHEHVLQKMLKSPDRLYFLWITKSVEKDLRARLSITQQETGSIILILENLDKAEKFLFTNAWLKNIIIICQPNLMKDVKMLNRRGQIVIVIQYPAQFCLEVEYQNQEFQDFAIYKAVNEQILIKLIKKQSQSKSRSYKQLMNFVSLKDIHKSNILIGALIALLKQQIDLTTRRQITNQFSKLAKKVDKDNNFEQLIQELNDGPLSPHKAIYWYTNESGVYKIINNLLRSSSHPSEVFYLQPLVKDIFTAIQQLHKKSKKSTFVCYRGGLLYENQVKELKENVGDFVKNLSFLSTSLSQQKAMEFKGNAFFEITVPQSQFQQKYFQSGSSYANVKGYSAYCGEEEVIFNPLCTFKIIQINERHLQAKSSSLDYFVRLHYGGLANILENKQQSQQQKPLHILAKIWREQENSIKNQGDALIFQKSNYENASNYWQKYYEIAKTIQDKLNGLINLALSQQTTGNSYNKILTNAKELHKIYYPNTYEYMQKNNKKLSQAQVLQIDSYYKIRLYLAYSEVDMGRYVEVQQMCEKYLKKIDSGSNYYKHFLEVLAGCFYNLELWLKFIKCKLLFNQVCEIYQKQRSKRGEYQNNCASLNNLSNSLRNMGNCQQALEKLQKCEKMLLSIIGKKHPTYIEFLIVKALTLMDLRELKQAIKIYEECCLLTIEILGINTTKYVYVLYCFANLLLLTGNYKRGQQLCEKSIKICQENFKQSQQFVIQCINSMVQLIEILIVQQKYQSALQKANKCHLLCVSQFGQNHPLSLKLLTKIGFVLGSLNRLNQAEQVLERSNRIRSNIVGQLYSDRILALISQIGIYYKLGKLDRASEVLQKCLNLSSSTFRKNHLIYTLLEESNVKFLQNFGRYEEALSSSKCLLKLITMKQRVIFINLLYSFANIHSHQGGYRKSNKIMQILYKMRVKVQRNKKNKSKQEMRTEQKWRKEKVKINGCKSFMHFENIQV